MKEINELFVTYQIALKLKELGFDKKCLGYFNSKGIFKFADCSRYTNIPFYYKNSECETWLSTIFSSKKTKSKICVAPIWQQAIDFLREKYNIVLTPDIRIIDKCTFFHIKQYDEIGFWVNTQENPLPYYEAREQAILKAIELWKKN